MGAFGGEAGIGLLLGFQLSEAAGFGFGGGTLRGLGFDAFGFGAGAGFALGGELSLRIGAIGFISEDASEEGQEGDDDDDNGAFHGWVYQLRLERRKCFKTMASVQGSAREKIPRSFSSRKCNLWKLRDPGVRRIGRRVGQRKRQRLAPAHAADEPRVQ